MKYYILIDLSDADISNNCLIMENVLDKSLLDYLEDKEEIFPVIKDCLVNSKPIPSEYEMEYLTLDDVDVSIPISNRLILILENDKPYKFFGDYANYVLGLYAEDICAACKSDVTIIDDEANEHPKYESNVRLTDGNYIKLTGIYIGDNTYFD